MSENYAACFAKGSPLLAEFNAALEALIADGTIASIIEYYIPVEE